MQYNQIPEVNIGNIIIILKYSKERNVKLFYNKLL